MSYFCIASKYWCFCSLFLWVPKLTRRTHSHHFLSIGKMPQNIVSNCLWHVNLQGDSKYNSPKSHVVSGILTEPFSIAPTSTFFLLLFLFFLSSSFISFLPSFLPLVHIENMGINYVIGFTTLYNRGEKGDYQLVSSFTCIPGGPWGRGGPYLAGASLLECGCSSLVLHTHNCKMWPCVEQAWFQGESKRDTEENFLSFEVLKSNLQMAKGRIRWMNNNNKCLWLHSVGTHQYFMHQESGAKIPGIQEQKYNLSHLLTSIWR